MRGGLGWTREEKTERANDYARASWGAAVLRPYMILPSS